MDVIARAKELGFDLAGAVAARDIACKRELRDLCNPDACIHYATCWSCPPGAGDFSECEERIAARTEGIVVQTVRHGVSFGDDALLDQIRRSHNERLDQLAEEVRAHHENALEFSTGGCDLCQPCTYPDAPCSKPQQQRLALSAHGVDVPTLCQRAGLEYAFGDGTIRFIGLVLC
jgi:predicted metal-binding protein